MVKHCIIRVHGGVHGVSFRYYTKRTADILGLIGLVHNESDGTVCVKAQGEKEDLQKLIDWCQQGPSDAQVSKVDAEFSDELKNYSGFIIEY